jgi:hypothetical protein
MLAIHRLSPQLVNAQPGFERPSGAAAGADADTGRRESDGPERELNDAAP